jgi:hypothetical protein
MMAAEYSRELSTKVFAGQCRLIEHGFRQGGAAGFGLRRRLIDQGGVPKTELARGEHKSIQTDRVVLVPGPPEEVALVQWMYRAFVHEARSEGLRWRLRFDTGLDPDITVAVRLDVRNRRPLDYYLFPRLDLVSASIRLAEENGLSLDAYRFDSLDTLYNLAAPVRLREAA